LPIELLRLLQAACLMEFPGFTEDLSGSGHES
jgi:hypothetical protein